MQFLTFIFQRKMLIHLLKFAKQKIKFLIVFCVKWNLHLWRIILLKYVLRGTGWNIYQGQLVQCDKLNIRKYTLQKLKCEALLNFDSGILNNTILYFNVSCNINFNTCKLSLNMPYIYNLINVQNNATNFRREVIYRVGYA